MARRAQRFSLVSGLWLLLAVAWLFASNHCAVSTLVELAAASHVDDDCTDCDHGKQPAPDSGDEHQSPCCKEITKVTAFSVSTARILKPLPRLLPPFDLAAIFPSVVGRYEPAPDYSDTGPPGSRSFPEIVLHRCLRGNAPPFLS